MISENLDGARSDGTVCSILKFGTGRNFSLSGKDHGYKNHVIVPAELQLQVYGRSTI